MLDIVIHLKCHESSDVIDRTLDTQCSKFKSSRSSQWAKGAFSVIGKFQ